MSEWDIFFRTSHTVQDGLYASVRDAKEQLPDQYRNVAAEWHAIP